MCVCALFFFTFFSHFFIRQANLWRSLKHIQTQKYIPSSPYPIKQKHKHDAHQMSDSSLVLVVTTKLPLLLATVPISASRLAGMRKPESEPDPSPAPKTRRHPALRAARNSLPKQEYRKKLVEPLRTYTQCCTTSRSYSCSISSPRST